jgi:hypothetical protein
MALFYVIAKKTLTRDFILDANNTREADTLVCGYLLIADDDEIEWENPEEIEIISEIKEGDVETPSEE